MSGWSLLAFLVFLCLLVWCGNIILEIYVFYIVAHIDKDVLAKGFLGSEEALKHIIRNYCIRSKRNEFISVQGAEFCGTVLSKDARHCLLKMTSEFGISSYKKNFGRYISTIECNGKFFCLEVVFEVCVFTPIR